LTVAVRLLIAPIVAFGPICGVAVAVLTYGSGTPADLATAATLRKAATWVRSRPPQTRTRVHCFHLAHASAPRYPQLDSKRLVSSRCCAPPAPRRFARC
jgi:hypothetical protein